MFDNRPEFWRLHAAPTARSLMNLAMRLPTPELESQFLRDAQAAGFSGLEGHRSVGGVRLSLYNGVTLAAVDCLADFLREFEACWDTAP